MAHTYAGPLNYDTCSGPLLLGKYHETDFGKSTHSPDHPVKKQYPKAYLLVSKGKLWWVLENAENKIEQVTDEHGNPLTWKTPAHGQPTSAEPIFETDPRKGQQQQKPEASAQQAEVAQVQQVLSTEAFNALAKQMNKLGILSWSFI